MRFNGQPQVQVRDAAQRGAALAARLRAWGSGGVGRWRQVLKLLLNSGDVGIDGFIKQTGLSSIKLFAAAAQLPALESISGCQQAFNVCSPDAYPLQPL